jgi:hypothetical protein
MPFIALWSVAIWLAALSLVTTCTPALHLLTLLLAACGLSAAPWLVLVASHKQAPPAARLFLGLNALGVLMFVAALPSAWATHGADGRAPDPAVRGGGVQSTQVRALGGSYPPSLPPAPSSPCSRLTRPVPPADGGGGVASR